MKAFLKKIFVSKFSIKSYKIKRGLVYFKINAFIKKQNFRRKILTLILKVIIVNSFSVKVVLGEQNAEIKQKIRNIKIRNPNNKVEKFEININLHNDSKSFISKEDVETFTRINRDTMKKLEADEKQAADDAKKKAEKEAKDAEAKKKQEEEENKPWIVKQLLALKTFFTPNQVFFNSVKFGLSMPQNNSISASETTISGAVHDLFTGTDRTSFMPFVAISAGFDAERLFRYELELGYFLFAGSATQVNNNSIYSTSQFDVSKNVLNFSLLNMSLNGFIKFSLPDLNIDFLKGSEFFFGGGIGIGYAIPKSGYLQSALVLPTFQVMSGFTFRINERFKSNVYWKMLYANFSFGNQTAFADLNNVLANNRAIASGNFQLSNFTAHFICFDIMWTY